MTKPKPKGRTTTKTTGKPTGALTPQPHGGAIRNGGPNKGGTGRPPSIIRAAMRDTLDAEVLADLNKRYKAKEIEALEYANFLAKYGLGTTKELSVEAVRERVAQTLEVVRRFVPADQLAACMEELRPLWA